MTFIHPTADVEPGVSIGADTKVWHRAHIRSGASIGSRCVLGKDVYIDVDVVIGDGVKIQNGVSVYRGVTLGDDVFVGPHAVFTNDRYPRASSSDWTVVPTIVHRGASIGANATIVCGVELGAYCVVGAGAVVTRSVDCYTIVVGNPARFAGAVCERGHPLRYLLERCEMCPRGGQS